MQCVRLGANRIKTSYFAYAGRWGKAPLPPYYIEATLQGPKHISVHTTGTSMILSPLGVGRGWVVFFGGVGLGGGASGEWW